MRERRKSEERRKGRWVDGAMLVSSQYKKAVWLLWTDSCMAPVERLPGLQVETKETKMRRPLPSTGLETRGLSPGPAREPHVWSLSSQSQDDTRCPRCRGRTKECGGVMAFMLMVMWLHCLCFVGEEP